MFKQHTVLEGGRGRRNITGRMAELGDRLELLRGALADSGLTWHLRMESGS